MAPPPRRVSPTFWSSPGLALALSCLGLLACGDEPSEAFESDEASASAAVEPGQLGEFTPQITAGGAKTCAVLGDQHLRCWGRNDHGRLGFALPEAYYGDDEPANAVPLIDLGQPITAVSPQTSTACVQLADGQMRCWGGGTIGALGIPWTGWLGDDETLLDGAAIDFAGSRADASAPVDFAAGGSHACALFEDGTMKCWGWGKDGATGYGTPEALGDQPGELPAELPAVDVGAKVQAISAGARNTCAILEGGALKCWGHPGLGKLGLGVDEVIGDDETPAAIEPIVLAGGPVVQVEGQGRFLCARHEEGSVSCWGEAGPWLGYGKIIDEIGPGLGDDEHPASLGVVELGAKAVEIAVGSAFACARLEGGGVKCWGASNKGQLGYGNTDFVGYEQTPAEVGTLELGGPAARLVAGWDHACALLEDDTLRCWGQGSNLGYGSTENIGDDETPAEAGPVPFI